MSKKKLRALEKELKEVNNMSKEQVLALQQEKFRALLKYAARHSPYYREVLADLPLDEVDITQLPILTKSVLMSRFDEIVTSPELKLEQLWDWLADLSTVPKLYKDRWLILKTSGTTGEAAVIVADPMETYRNSAAISTRDPVKRPPLFQALKLVLRGLFKPWNVAVIALCTGRGSSGYVASFQLPKPPSFVQVQYLNVLDPIHKLVEELNGMQPPWLFGTPSILDTLANEQLLGRLKLRFPPFGGISTGGEMLYPSTRRKVREAWGMEIQASYGATECGVIARTCCDFEHFHVMSDSCILEVVDEQNNPVPNGQMGAKVLLTNLHAYDQPLIRYEIKDVLGYATEDHDCGLPFPLLMGIEGRTDENFLLHDQNGEQVPLRREHFLALADLEPINCFQLIQVDRNSFLLKYTLQETYQSPQKEAETCIRAALEEIAPVPIHIDLQQVEEFTIGASGKFRMFENRYCDPNAENAPP